MAYLIFKSNFSAWEKRQMDRYAIKISEGVWLYNKRSDEYWKGARYVRLDHEGLSDLADLVEIGAKEKIQEVEQRIRKGNLQGRAIQYLCKVLNMVKDLSLDIETISHALDLLFLLGEGDGSKKAPEKTAELRADPLGFDRDSVKKYLLSVAKKEPIH